MANTFPTIRPSLLLNFAATKQLDPRITFTRASGGAAYYDGKTTVKAEENLFTYSEQFDNAAWTKTNTTITTNSTTAPDGTTTADTITASASASGHDVRQVSSSVTGTERVCSVYVKQGTHTFIQLAFGSATTAYANFDVTTGAGATGTVGAAATASIVDAGSGWFRCIITTSSATASGTILLYVISSGTAARGESWTPLGTETMYLWGAQIEQRSAVTAYTATTTQAIKNYIPQLLKAGTGVPRFDHNPVTGESLGLLVEAAATNLLTYSEDYSNAAWTKTRSSISSNVLISPDGALTADKLVEDTTAASTHSTTKAISMTSGTVYTGSVYVKKCERTWVFVQFSSGAFGTVKTAYFNLTTGVVGTTAASTTASITDVGNDWYRCSITATATATATSSLGTFLATADGTSSYTGDGYSGIYIWGAQLETGSTATSYITTVASTVTRAIDSAAMTGTNFSSWYNQSEGTFYAEFNASSTIGAIVNFDDTGSATNRHAINLTTATNLQSRSIVSGVAQCTLNQTVTAFPAFIKTCLSYNTDDFAAVSNGGTAAVDTSGTVPVVNTLRIGNNHNAAAAINGTIKTIAYYPKALPASLPALTS